MNNQLLYSFFITCIAGISTLISTVFIFFKFKKIDNIIVISLSFASGVMITLSIFDLIPEAFKNISEIYNFTFSLLLILFFMNIGIIISNFINKLLPDYSKLYRVGIISLLAIILHNIPEGMITFITGNINIKIGISLALAISMHNIPEGVAISIPIYYATKSKYKAFIYTLIAGLSEIIGAILAFLFFPYISNLLFIGLLSSIIAGIMIKIAISELLPHAINYKKNNLVIISLIFGILFMLLCHFILK